MCKIQSIQFSFLLVQVHAVEDPADNPDAWNKLHTLWPPLCHHLASLSALRQVNIWLDAIDGQYRWMMLKNPQLFAFAASLAPIVTLNLPLKIPDRLAGELESLAYPCTVVRRDYPVYYPLGCYVTTNDRMFRGEHHARLSPRPFFFLSLGYYEEGQC